MTRGNILRQGDVLVSNSMFFSYAADPKIVGDGAAAVAKKFSQVFGKPEEFYLQKMQDEKRFVWLERHVSPEVAKRLQANALEGVAELTSRNVCIIMIISADRLSDAQILIMSESAELNIRTIKRCAGPTDL